MQRRNSSGRLAPAAVVAAFFLAISAAGSLTAQAVTGTLAGEVAGDDVALLLGDLTGAWGMGNVVPVASLTAYVVSFDTGDGRNRIFAVTPAVGLRARRPGGFLQGTIGYSFQTETDDASPFFGGGGDGVTTGVHAEHWGSGRFGLQAIGHYNWASEFLWTRARGTAGVLDGPSGSLHLGAEAGWQGDLGPGGYEALQVGPVLRWVTDRWAGTVAGGFKDIHGGDETWYARFDVSVPLRTMP